MRIQGRTLLAGAVLALVAGTAASALAGDHDMVSSDGVLPRVAMSADFSPQEKGFEGTGRRGMQRGEVDDLFAEFKANSESPREFERLLGLKPEKDPNAEPDTTGLKKDIIGSDNRVQVTATTTYPNSAIVLITTNTGRCTGFLIGIDTVVTAGHCVHSGGTKGAWKTNVTVYPGRNGDETFYGSCSAARLFSVKGWTQSRLATHDYGAIKLNCTIGQRTGWLGYFWTSSSLNNIYATLRGYPGDKPLTMWTMDGFIRVSQERRLYYLTDTADGQSGSPVYYNRPNCGWCAMAIHAKGLGTTYPGSRYNSGTRITEAVFNNLKAWKAAPQS